MQQKIIDIVREVTSYVNSSIASSNQPGKKKDNSFFAPFVLKSQNEADQILSDTSISLLERILKCSQVVQNNTAGNCLLQTFVTLDLLIKSFINREVSNYEGCIPISICTTENHAFLIVNNNILCDPWKNTVEYLGENFRCEEYFGIRSNWVCATNFIDFDPHSTEFTINFFNHNQLNLARLS